MREVVLHVYDLTNFPNEKFNNFITRLNILFRDWMGVGGIFHGAIQVYDKEWDFGFTTRGSGVGIGPPKKNPVYTYRESVYLGTTSLSRSDIDEIFKKMIVDWKGCRYHLLSRNCNHFCEAFSAKLGVRELPLWLNQFAKTCDSILSLAKRYRRFTGEKLNKAKEFATRTWIMAARLNFSSQSVSHHPRSD